LQLWAIGFIILSIHKCFKVEPKMQGKQSGSSCFSRDTEMPPLEARANANRGQAPKVIVALILSLVVLGWQSAYFQGQSIT
jgi:hypothetical protein